MNSEERFELCIKIILEHEGGLSNDKRDPGSVTQWGISLRFLKSAGIDVDRDGDIDSDDIVGLNKPAAIEIYRKYWWNKYKYERFKFIEIVSKVFDLSVNMGAVSSHKILQRSCNTFMKTKLKVDGILGMKTLIAANTLDPTNLREAMRGCAKDRYVQILEANPAMEWARNGWINRASW